MTIFSKHLDTSTHLTSGSATFGKLLLSMVTRRASLQKVEPEKSRHDSQVFQLRLITCIRYGQIGQLLRNV